MPKLHPEDPCPCGSGRTYARCCSGQDFEWRRNEEGGWSRVIPLAPEIAELLIARESKFRELFGRAPGRHDLLLFDTNAMYSPAAFDRAFDDLMHQAGVADDVAYASSKTGLILTEANKSRVTGKDLDDWREAIDEYHRPVAQESDEKRLAEGFLEHLMAEFSRCRVVMGMVTTKGDDVHIPADREFGLMHTLFCLTKSIRTMGAIESLTDEGFGEDALILIRSMFEAYLHVAYSLSCPDRAELLAQARVGLIAGTHRYLKSARGRTDFSRIEETASGRVLDVGIGFKAMAKASPFAGDIELYDTLYEFLSGYAHPDISAFPTYVDGATSTYEHSSRALFFEARTMALLVGVLFLQTICDSGYLSEEFKADIEYYLYRTRSFALELGQTLGSALAEPFCERLGRLPVEPSRPAAKD